MIGVPANPSEDQTAKPPEVLFYHLDQQPLDRVLPSLVERTVGRGWRAVVQAGTPERLEAIDNLLWTFKDDSFLAHGTEKDGLPADQPVFLTTGESNPNAAAVRFLACEPLLAPTNYRSRPTAKKWKERTCTSGTSARFSSTRRYLSYLLRAELSCKRRPAITRRELDGGQASRCGKLNLNPSWPAAETKNRLH